MVRVFWRLLVGFVGWIVVATVMIVGAASITSPAVSFPLRENAPYVPMHSSFAPLPVQGTAEIPSSFFAVTIIDARDYPQLSIGALGHPTTLVWGWLEGESRGTYRWSVTDAYVRQAVEHHIPVTLTIGKTPEWAVANRSSCRPHAEYIMCDGPPANLADWREFITALATHYKGQVQYYELWNEANQPNFWKGTPEDLAALAKAAYPIIKAIDPEAIVLTPSTVGPLEQSIDWMTSYLKAGGGEYADGGSFHGYLAGRQVTPFPGPEQDLNSGCSPSNLETEVRLSNSPRNNISVPRNHDVGRECFGSLQAKIESYRSLFDRYGLKGKPMFDTEGSWGNATISDQDVQGSFLARWYLIQASYFQEANLRQACWYAWGYRPGHTWGVIANPDDTPSEAGQAYSEIYHWLVGATLSPCTHDKSIWTCSMTRNNSYKAMVLWDNSQTCKSGSCTTTSYLVPSGYTQYRDLSGATTRPIGKTIPIGLKPILLESK
jgi:hypothetical protein